jgi:hypothetical protein
MPVHPHERIELCRYGPGGSYIDIIPEASTGLAEDSLIIDLDQAVGERLCACWNALIGLPGGAIRWAAEATDSAERRRRLMQLLHAYPESMPAAAPAEVVPAPQLLIGDRP